MITNQLLQQSIKEISPNISPQSNNSSPDTPVKKEVYYCECGKKYMSFPALYVHARIKHNLKLSSNSRTQHWKTKLTGTEVEKTFYLQYGIENSQNQPMLQRNLDQNRDLIISRNSLDNANQDMQTLSDIFELFMNDSKESNFTWKIVRGLLIFLSNKWGQIVDRETLGLIPYELNSFAMESLPLILETQHQREQWVDACQILLEFGKWLHKQHYTKFLAVPNN